MLILTKKMGEEIVIDDEIKITILEIKGTKVRLGIEAPEKVKVHYKKNDLNSAVIIKTLVLNQPTEIEEK